MICKNCDGTGMTNLKQPKKPRGVCLECNGKGSLDWLETIIGMDNEDIIFWNKIALDKLLELKPFWEDEK
jgi:hypothetical protein